MNRDVWCDKMNEKEFCEFCKTITADDGINLIEQNIYWKNPGEGRTIFMTQKQWFHLKDIFHD